jgi:hypothetical protein
VYWRAGFGRAVLWIASLTCFLSALAALRLAGSAHAAEALALTGLVLSPPLQEVVARFTHVRGPAKLAFYAVITLLPLAVFFIAIDGIAVLEASARQRGFASAAEMERARQISITTPEALAARDEAARQRERDRLCHVKPGRQPLLCFSVAHRSAAQAFAGTRLHEGQFLHVVTDAIAEQRKQFLAADRSCQALLDRIDEDAVPVMLTARGEAVDMLAALWAARLGEGDLGLIVSRIKPGASYIKTQDVARVEDRIADAEPQIDGQLVEEIKYWSQRIVLVPSGWRAVLGIKPSPDSCKMVEASLLQ